MKSSAARFVLWFFFDVCLAAIPCGLFWGLVSGSMADGKETPYGWLFVCGLLAFIMLARLFRAGYTYFTNYDIALGWRILAFFMHFGVLAAGLNVTGLVTMLLMGAGASVGEPG